MADDKSAKWIILIILYFFVMFAVTWWFIASVNIVGVTDTNDIHIRDPGFMGSTEKYCDDPFINPSEHTYFFGGVKCSGLDIDNAYDCNQITGCGWENSSTELFWFINIGKTGCFGEVNNSFMGYFPDLTNQENYCQGSYFNDQIKCEQFGCTWHEIDRSLENEINARNVNVFSMLGFVVGINSNDFDIGIPDIIAWIYRIIFFYVPFLMLILILLTYIPTVGS